MISVVVIILFLDKDWHVDGSLPMSGYTQTSRTRVEGKDEIAYYGHPFEFDLYYRTDDERDRGLFYFKLIINMIFEV